MGDGITYQLIVTTNITLLDEIIINGKVRKIN